MKSILLIEDDPFLIDIYTAKLKEEGFSVEVVIDGEKGLKKLSEKKFDLLLLDIVLPKIDGWEILQKIQNLKAGPRQNEGRVSAEIQNLKVVVLSNLGQKKDVEKAFNLGATEYLIKAHYSPNEVVEEIKQILI